MDLKHIQAITNIVGQDNLILDCPMSGHTTFRVGGPAECLVTPTTVDEISATLEYCRNNEIEYLVIGNGSNLLVKDGGVAGVVIDLSSKFNNISVDGLTVTAQAGALLSRVARKAWAASLTGMEFAEGIPGTIGGAVYMNAGAYGGEMCQIVDKVTCLTQDGQIVTFQGEDHGFAYRHSAYMGSGMVILEASLNLTLGDSEAIKATMDDLRGRRRDKQPTDKPSAGSTFKRPANGYAAAMIEQCGLKGFRVGGAEVSTKHSGFVINAGGATATDILTLMDQVADKVQEQFGVRLEPEVQIVGRD